MSIQVNLDLMMVRRHISAGELAERVGITPANLSFSKTTRRRLCASPRWTPCAARWTASPPTCWNTSRMRNPPSKASERRASCMHVQTQSDMRF